MALYVVLSPLGPHLPGQVIDVTDEQVAAGAIEIQRCLDLGALREAPATEADDAVVLFGTNDPDRYLRPIPRVDPTPEAVAPKRSKSKGRLAPVRRRSDGADHRATAGPE